MATIVRGKTTVLDVSCPHCQGSGLRKVTGAYFRTYQLVEANPRLNGAQLAAIAKVKPTAMNNRLMAMSRLGLLQFEEDGRQKLWWIVD